MEKTYFVYALYSMAGKRLYIGMSCDIVKRVHAHNAGMTRSTKPYRPWVLIYEEAVGTRPQARAREKFLKSGCGREFLKQFIPG